MSRGFYAAPLFFLIILNSWSVGDFMELSLAFAKSMVVSAGQKLDKTQAA